MVIGIATPSAKAVDMSIAVVAPVSPLVTSPLIKSLIAFVRVIPGKNAIIDAITILSTSIVGINCLKLRVMILTTKPAIKFTKKNPNLAS